MLLVEFKSLRFQRQKFNQLITNLDWNIFVGFWADPSPVPLAVFGCPEAQSLSKYKSFAFSFLECPRARKTNTPERRRLQTLPCRLTSSGEIQSIRVFLWLIRRLLRHQDVAAVQIKPWFVTSSQMETLLEGNCSSDTYKYMQCAIEQAKLALDALEVPVGCVVVEGGEIIATGRNRTTETRNATRHAEMEAIDDLLRIWQRNGLTPPEVAEKFSNCNLYVTCEPCIMCAGALSILGFKEVYFGCGNDKFGGCGSVLSLHSSSSHPRERIGDSEASAKKGFKCTGGIMAEEAVSLFRSFYEQGNPNAPKPHRPVRVSSEASSSISLHPSI